MLIMIRGKNESVIIGRDVEVKVSRVSGRKVDLAIDAPRSIRICRKEIYNAIPRRAAQQDQDRESP